MNHANWSCEHANSCSVPGSVISCRKTGICSSIAFSDARQNASRANDFACQLCNMHKKSAHGIFGLYDQLPPSIEMRMDGDFHGPDTCMAELLTPEQMGRADRHSIESGPFTGIQLMRNAGHAVAAEILSGHEQSQRFAVLAGPGNNGGDAYVVADLLLRAGARVEIFSLGSPRQGTDAFEARKACRIDPAPLADYVPGKGDVVVDGLFGAGLDREITGAALDAIARTRSAGTPVVAIDLPSGLSGATGAILGDAFSAELTVTFFRKKPGHLLYPGRRLCGRVIVADIGISESVLRDIAVTSFENGPSIWKDMLPVHGAETHKYLRGAVAVFSGGPSSTGAARLAAAAAVKTGAGAATVLSPPAALIVNASHLTSIMVAPVADRKDLDRFLSSGKTSSLVIGPGFGTGHRLREFALAILAPDISKEKQSRALKGVVLDADALSEFAHDPQTLFAAISAAGRPVVMTPHEGEFARLFPDIASAKDRSKLERAVAASERSGAVVLLKGADTVIASPEGKAAINSNGNINLATAGSGDVLSGITASLLAQGMEAWPAACAAAWIHGEAGRKAGFGAIAEDLAERVRFVMKDICAG